MDGAVDAAAAEQRGVGGVDERVDVERRDVGDADLEPRRSDISGEQGRDAHARHCSTRGRRRIGRWHRSQPIVPDERGVVMPWVRDVGDADLES